ncbi:TetR/AcrR family transcriptional regulator [Evansella tamaricis]|uniref:TetR/AcrR family transcriptional regulator n=1 Tax=Evansella tamaricis TaxID=2069301 RepID=A0ABS6JIZ6_9BACI|nr:TetR/AcrR family transcriptional regulator [Evansella tamaricis]MBU9712298.1 TetR/AcrR family transcriptional regulator [Evansella tamaricis]
MPPKNKFSKEQIIDAAFLIAKSEGLDNISMRKIAEKIGSSVAPIYVNFDNVDELKSAVVKKLVDISKEILEEQNSGQPFLDIGIASLLVAKEYKALFVDLTMKPNSYAEQYNQQMEKDLIARIKMDPVLEGFSQAEMMSILLKMKIFQTGLSIMVANQLLPEEFTEEQLIYLLQSTGNDIISSTRKQK